jgi:hypothetical protein
VGERKAVFRRRLRSGKPAGVPRNVDPQLPKGGCGERGGRRPATLDATFRPGMPAARRGAEAGGESAASESEGGNGPRAMISTMPERSGKWAEEPKGRTGRRTIRWNAEALGQEH